MNAERQLLYGLGLVTGFLLIAYGLYPQYDQLRLGLVASGIPLLIIVVFSFVGTVDEEDKIKKMNPFDLQKLRPDLMVASKLTVELPRELSEKPIDQGPEWAAKTESIDGTLHSAEEMVEQWRQNKFYDPNRKVIGEKAP